jgi:arsenate reductase
MNPKPTVLFLCTGNACRSQMAEGWARAMWGHQFEVYSAGVAPAGVDPLAVEIMKEAGVDISSHWSKHVSQLSDKSFDFVVILCEMAAASCPNFSGPARVIRTPVEDPVRLTRGVADLETKRGIYRRIRDEIRQLIETLPQSLADQHPQQVS